MCRGQHLGSSRLFSSPVMLLVLILFFRNNNEAARRAEISNGDSPYLLIRQILEMVKSENIDPANRLDVRWPLRTSKMDRRWEAWEETTSASSSFLYFHFNWARGKYLRMQTYTYQKLLAITHEKVIKIITMQSCCCLYILTLLRSLWLTI